MIEGGGVKEYTKAKALFYSDPIFVRAFARQAVRAVGIFSNSKLTLAADAVRF